MLAVDLVARLIRGQFPTLNVLRGRVVARFKIELTVKQLFALILYNCNRTNVDSLSSLLLCPEQQI